MQLNPEIRQAISGVQLAMKAYDKIIGKQKISFRFIFQMGFIVGGFNKIKNIQRRIDRDKYQEGGFNSQPIILAKPQTELSTLVLEKGFVTKPIAVEYLKQEIKDQKQLINFGFILVLNKYYLPIRIFHFEQGIVSEWSMSDLDAQNPGIIIDSITIHHTGLIEDTIL